MPPAGVAVRTGGQVHVPGAHVGDGAHGLDLGLHLHQHAAHVRVVDDRHRAVAARQAALAAFARILQRVLVSPFRDREPLHADADPRVIHHREHAGESLVRFTDEVSRRVVVLHHAGRAAVDAELLLERQGAHAVAFAQRAVSLEQHLRHQEERDAAHPRRRVRQPGEDEVHDVLGHVVIAVGDENLLAAHPVRVAVRNGGRADEREVRPGLRLGEVHGAGPGAGDEVREPRRLEFGTRVFLDGVDRAPGQQRAVRPSQVG